MVKRCDGAVTIKVAWERAQQGRQVQWRRTLLNPSSVEQSPVVVVGVAVKVEVSRPDALLKGQPGGVRAPPRGKIECVIERELPVEIHIRGKVRKQLGSFR